MNENFKPHYLLLVAVPAPKGLGAGRYIEIACAENYYDIFFVQLNLISGYRMLVENFPPDWNKLNNMECCIHYYTTSNGAILINKINITYYNPEEIFYFGSEALINDFDPFKILQ